MELELAPLTLDVSTRENNHNLGEMIHQSHKLRHIKRNNPFGTEPSGLFDVCPNQLGSLARGVGQPISRDHHDLECFELFKLHRVHVPRSNKQSKLIYLSTFGDILNDVFCNLLANCEISVVKTQVERRN